MGRDRSPEQVPDQVGDWNKRRGREAPPLVVCGHSRSPIKSGTGKWMASEATAGSRSGAGTAKLVVGTGERDF